MDMERLIKGLVSGSQEAWSELLDRFSRLIYKVLYTRSFGFSREEIEELFNDVVVNLMKDNYRKIRLFEGRNHCSFPSYLKKIVINMAIDRRKRLTRTHMTSLQTSLNTGKDREERELLHVIDSGAADPNEILVEREETTQFLDALYRLDPAKLLIMLLIVYHDMDRVELGKLMKKTRQNIDVIFNRTKEQLKKLIRTQSKKREGDGERTPWPEWIQSKRDALVLGDRKVIFKRCSAKLSVPAEMLVGIIFLNAVPLDPTPERMALLLKCRDSSLQVIIERSLNKIIPGE